MNKKIAHGAEAIIILSDKKIIKDRISKSYRLAELDNKIRKSRTKREAKLISKSNSIIPSPKLIKSNEKEFKIEMQFIEGKKLSTNLENLDYKKISKQIGENLTKLHDSDIIHGDLTTSNMIYNPQEDKTYFIDFGLGFISARIEDKAVDLHLIKEALESKHPTIYNEVFEIILESYKSSENYDKTLQQLKKVEKRGRYKTQY